MRSIVCVAFGAFLFVITTVSARADTDLTGKWTGQFVGVQIEIPPDRGPFGHVRDETKPQAARFVDNPLELDIETQNKGLAIGTWTAGEFKKHFVCAQTNPTVWQCMDSGGHASVEVASSSEIKVCYFDNREGAQGAGCATLRRSK
jgi:hypothetical protein